MVADRPKVYRSMKKDMDGFPLVESSASGLGVRVGSDIELDGNGNVQLNGGGMSVAPGWRDLPLHRIPKRLMNLVPGAIGSNNTFCFTTGEGPFIEGDFTRGLRLLPDKPNHANLVPANSVPLNQFESDLAATREEWIVDEV